MTPSLGLSTVLDMNRTEIPAEVRDMLASMGMRHPLDMTADEQRDANLAARERIAKAAAKVGNHTEVKRQRRVIDRAK